MAAIERGEDEKWTCSHIRTPHPLPTVPYYCTVLRLSRVTAQRPTRRDGGILLRWRHARCCSRGRRALWGGGSCGARGGWRAIWGRGARRARGWGLVCYAGARGRRGFVRCRACDRCSLAVRCGRDGADSGSWWSIWHSSPRPRGRRRSLWRRTWGSRCRDLFHFRRCCGTRCRGGRWALWRRTCCRRWALWWRDTCCTCASGRWPLWSDGRFGRWRPRSWRYTRPGQRTWRRPWCCCGSRGWSSTDQAEHAIRGVTPRE